MKIEQGNITITDIPVFESIEVTADRIYCVINAAADGYDLTCDKVTELRDALTAALDAHTRLNGELVSSAPHVFNENDAEPGPEVTKLRDREGDVWVRQGDGWNYGSVAHLWSYALEFAPLTDVTNA